MSGTRQPSVAQQPPVTQQPSGTTQEARGGEPSVATTASERVRAGEPGFPRGLAETEALIAQKHDEAWRDGIDPRVLHPASLVLRHAAYDELMSDARTAVRSYASAGLGDPVLQGSGERVIGDFRVSPRAEGGHTAVHVGTGTGVTFDGRGRWISREYRLHDAHWTMDDLKAVVDRGWDPTGKEVLSYRTTGPDASRFTVRTLADDAVESPQARFVVTRRDTGDRYLFTDEGTLTLRDLRLREGLGYLRFDLARAGAAPEVVDQRGKPSEDWDVVTADNTGVTLHYTGDADHRLVIDPDDGGRMRELVALKGSDDEPYGRYAEIDHLLRTVRRVDLRGRVLSGPSVEAHFSAQGLRLTQKGGRQLFTRPLLGTDFPPSDELPPSHTADWRSPAAGHPETGQGTSLRSESASPQDEVSPGSHMAEARRSRAGFLARLTGWRGAQDEQGRDSAELTAADPADLRRLHFQREAERFERRLGHYLVTHPRTQEQLSRFLRALWKMTPRQNRHQFGTLDASFVGAVGKDLTDLKAVVEGGNVREQMAALWQFMQQRGMQTQLHHRTDLPEHFSQMREWRVHDPEVRTPAVEGYRDILPLSERERAFTYGGKFWRGAEMYIGVRHLPPDSQPWKTIETGPQAQAQRTGGLVKTGVSSSTWLLLDYAEAANRKWGLGLDLGWLRLAMFGAMLSNGAHTAHEMLRAASIWAKDPRYPERQGLGFEYLDNPGRYRSFAPLTEEELRQHVALGGLFPDELAHGTAPAAYDPVEDAREALARHLAETTTGPGTSERVPASDSRAAEFVVKRVGDGHRVTHQPTRLTTVFSGPRQEITAREVRPSYGPGDLRGAKIRVRYTRDRDGGLVKHLAFATDLHARRFELTEVPRAVQRRWKTADFTVVDRNTGNRTHFAADGRVLAEDRMLGHGLGMLRFDMVRPGTTPQLMDSAGRRSSVFRVEPLDSTRVALAQKGQDTLCSDCPLACKHLVQLIADDPKAEAAAPREAHPIEVFARAYGVL